MILTEAQSDYIEESFSDFAKTLDKKQLRQLYFRLDDIIQYGAEALRIAYVATAKVYKKKEGGRK